MQKCPGAVLGPGAVFGPGSVLGPGAVCGVWGGGSGCWQLRVGCAVLCCVCPSCLRRGNEWSAPLSSRSEPLRGTRVL